MRPLEIVRVCPFQQIGLQMDVVSVSGQTFNRDHERLHPDTPYHGC